MRILDSSNKLMAIVTGAALVVATVGVLAPAARAADGTWIGGSSVNWFDTNNWQGGIVAEGVGAVATIQTNTDGITIDQNLTLGSWVGNDGWANMYSAPGRTLTWDTGPGGGAAVHEQFGRYKCHNLMYMHLESDLIATYTSERGWRDPPGEGSSMRGAISGPGKLTLNVFFMNWDGSGNVKYRIMGHSPNTYSGGTELNVVQWPGAWGPGNNRYEDWNRCVLMKDGALGTGDVTMMNPNVKTRITDDSADPETDGDDRISDTGEVYLVYGHPTDTWRGNQDAELREYSLIELDAGVHEVVAQLYFEDLEAAGGPVAQGPGTYGAVGSGADFESDDWFQGSGILEVVLTGPPTLVWDAADDDWTSANWTPDGGTTHIAPAGGEVMVVNSGVVTVSTDLTVLSPADSLFIARDAEGGTVEIASGGTLAAGDVDVGVGGTLNVKGSLAADSLDVTEGTLGLGDGAMVVSPLAGPDLSDVTVDIDGTLKAGGGVATIGDENNDLSSTNLTLGNGSIFSWTFGAGDNYVDVNGEVTFDGNLIIRLVDGGGTASGEDVALFRALDASIVDISSVTVLSPAGLGWTWDTDGGGNPVLTFGGEFLVLEGLVTGAAAVPGDTNGDGIVNDADLANFEAQFGGAPGAESADFDGDGDVDAHDFATIRGNWGFGTAPAPLPGGATPEPATMSLLAIGGLAVLRRPRRKAKTVV